MKNEISSAQIRSQQFLVEVLKDGAKPFREIQIEARKTQIYNGTLATSRRLLRIEIFRDSTTGETLWKLPD